MSGDLLGLVGGSVVLVAGILWWRRIGAVRIPTNRTGFFIAMGFGVVLGVAAFALGTRIVGGVAAGFAVVAGGMFLALRLQSSQDRREPAVSVGGKILDFTAPDENGAPFALAGLHGRPFLLKFFRGHW